MTEEEQSAANLLRRVKHNANNELIQFLNGLTREALSTYPDAEMETWPYQKMEADALLAAGDMGTLAMAPVIAAVCVAHFGPADDDVRLSQVLTKAAIVRQKDVEFMAAATYVNGLRARTQDQFEVADDPQNVLTILDAAQAEAIAVIRPAAAPPPPAEK